MNSIQIEVNQGSFHRYYGVSKAAGARPHPERIVRDAQHRAQLKFQ